MRATLRRFPRRLIPAVAVKDDLAVRSGPPVPDDKRARDVDHHQIRRGITRNVRHVVAQLSVRLPESPIRACSLDERLGFDGEVAVLPTVDEVGRFTPVPIDDVHRQLEAIVVGRRRRRADVQRLAESDQPRLERRPLVGVGGGPVGGEAAEALGTVGRDGGSHRHNS